MTEEKPRDGPPANGSGLEHPSNNKIPFWRIVIDQAGVTDAVRNHKYAGAGTEEDPFLVVWIPNDPRNPFNFSSVHKWSITLVMALATLAVAMISSAYSGGIRQIMVEFQISQEVATLGIRYARCLSPPEDSPCQRFRTNEEKKVYS